jgi:hypothetical protein
MTTPSESSQAPDLEAERTELLRLDEEGRRAHFATDAPALLAHDAEPVLYVREGAILSMTRMELLRVYADDMQGAVYHEWDLLEPPIVRIADDASIAWIITRRSIRRTKRQPDGTIEEQAFIYAGMNAYEKRMGAWVRLTNVSTFAEGDAKS